MEEYPGERVKIRLLASFTFQSIKSTDKSSISYERLKLALLETIKHYNLYTNQETQKIVDTLCNNQLVNVQFQQFCQLFEKLFSMIEQRCQ